MATGKEQYRPTLALRPVARSAGVAPAPAVLSPVAAHLHAVSLALASCAPALSAFAGARLRALAESGGVCTAATSRQASCEACGLPLLPGQTCSVRLKQTKKKRSRPAAASARTRNVVLLRCSHCGHTASLPGTPAGAVRMQPEARTPAAAATPASSLPASSAKRRRKGSSSATPRQGDTPGGSAAMSPLGLASFLADVAG
jgi:RNase P subunit RPR2